MSATSRLLEQIEEIYLRAGDGIDCSTWTDHDVHREADHRIRRARGMLDTSVSVDAVFEAARLLGECYLIAKEKAEKRLELETRSILAHGIGRMLAPNRDECRRYASRMFIQIADEFNKSGVRRDAAIDYTNAALCLFELHNPTASELAEAEKLCQKTIRMRERNTVDFAYSQMNLAVAKRMALPLSKEPDRRGSYAQILKELDRSFRVFKKFSQESSEYKSKYHANVVQTLNDWLAYEVSVCGHEADRVAFSSRSDLPNPAGLDPVYYCSALRSNPATLGFDSTPEWVPDPAEVVQRAMEKVDRLNQRLTKAESYVHDSSKGNSTLKLQIFKLRTALAVIDGDPLPPWDALDSIWDRKDTELYFIHASRIILGDSSDKSNKADKYHELLLRTSKCIVIFRKTWNVEDVVGLLERNPMTFRIAACELGRIGSWEAAFQLLEYSRGLNSSRSWSEDPGRYENTEETVTWVHVTHSPRATYALMRRGGRFDGVEFPELSGGALVPHFQKLGGTDLIQPGRKDRQAAVGIVTRIEDMFRPLASWISKRSGEAVALMPGGFYQAFPLWACGALGEDLTSGRKRITTVPSRTVAIRNAEFHKWTPQSGTILVANASDVPGQNPLSWSRNEGNVVAELFEHLVPVAIEDATTGNVTQGLQESLIFHFTGHSTAEPEPKDSALITYSGRVAAREILELKCSTLLAVFGSCESGLAMNFQDQDEMLSIQSAAYYAGVELSIGTSWPISDPTGFYFSARFYEHLSSAVESSSRPPIGADVIAAYSNAVSDLKRATNSEVRDLSLRYAITTMVPENSEKAFKFLDWAAFGIVGIDSNKIVDALA